KARKSSRRRTAISHSRRRPSPSNAANSTRKEDFDESSHPSRRCRHRRGRGRIRDRRAAASERHASHRSHRACGLRPATLVRAPVAGDMKGVSETVAQYQEPPPPSLPDLPSYKVEYKVVGGLRRVGSELKNAVDQLADEFMKFHPDAKVATSHIPSSEGGIAA